MGRALKYSGGELMVNVLTEYSSQNMILDVEGNPNGGWDVRKGNFQFYLGESLSLDSRTYNEWSSLTDSQFEASGQKDFFILVRKEVLDHYIWDHSATGLAPYKLQQNSNSLAKNEIHSFEGLAADKH